MDDWSELSHLEAVLLDAGGVLLLPDPVQFRRGLSVFGVEPDDATCHRAHFEVMHEVDRLGAHDYEEADRFLARWLGVAEADVAEAATAIADLYVRFPLAPVPGAADQLARLRDAGFALGVVSNASGTMEAQLADHRICSIDGRDAVEVAVVIDSEVVGVSKPDPAIFGLALQALATTADRAVFIGDSLHFDVRGALAAGIEPVHVDPYPLCQDREHRHVDSLRGLADRLLAVRHRR